VGVAGAVVVLGLVGAEFLKRKGESGAVVSGPQRLAVLPFENQGPPERNYFAEGMSDEVRGKLASLPGFVVVASTSSSQYKKSMKPMEQVARELGVRFLVVGKVRWEKAPSGDRVQVIPELVEVERSGAQVEKWRESFDARLTDVFQVQTEIAGKVAQSLDVSLSVGQQKAMAEKPTQSLAAYDAFLRGEKALSMNNREATAAYEQAVALDPAFALAWAHLSRAQSERFGVNPGSTKTPGREAAERAIALAPARPEGYEAFAKYYLHAENEPDKALVEIERAARLAPRDVEVVRRRAQIEWSLGRFDDALRHGQEAKQLDPRSYVVAHDLALTLVMHRRFREAMMEADRGQSLEPTTLEGLGVHIWVAMAEGDLAGARMVVRGASREMDPAGVVTSTAVWVLDDAQQRLLLTLGPDRFDDNQADWALARARTYALRGETAKMLEYADQARAAYDARLHEASGSGQRALLGIADAVSLAYLGRKSEAIAGGEQAASLMPLSRDVCVGSEIQENLTRVYILVGENEKALDRLDVLLKIPCSLTPGLLRIDPAFGPLRGNARFEKLARGE
jgi:TolB-like protein/Flp pilus assembly protein TadD